MMRYIKDSQIFIVMRTLRIFIVFLATSFLTLSCSKDSELSEEEKQIEQEINDSARLTAKNLYTDYYESSRSNGSETAWSGDEPSCDPGLIAEDVKIKMIRRLTYFRLAVGLDNELSENKDKSEKAQQAALMMQSNNQLDHFPPESWSCYTEAGKEGAGNSLLTTASKAEAIDSYMRDAGSANGPVGHRRWLLWPELQEIGLGNTDGANAIWVLNGGGASLDNTPEYIAWPPKGFVPNRLVYPRWSFSLKGADFTNAQVRMKNASGNSISVAIEELNNQFGDRTIVWVPENIQTNITEDMVYTVSIIGVEVGKEIKDFNYAVTIFDPSK